MNPRRVASGPGRRDDCPSQSGSPVCETPPWTPSKIELTTTNRAYWWERGEAAPRPEPWTVHAAVTDTDDCPDDVRHVGMIEVAVAELTDGGPPLNAASTERWVWQSLLAHAVADPGSGTLVPELERVMAPGPSRVVIVRRAYLNDVWRACGLVAPLLSAALHRVAPMARLAVCRVLPVDMARVIPGLTRAETAAAARHVSRLLAGAGFFPWHDLYLLDLQTAEHHDYGHPATDDEGTRGHQK